MRTSGWARTWLLRFLALALAAALVPACKKTTTIMGGGGGGTGSAPVAANDAFTVDEDSNNNNFDVLDNDVDPNGDPVSIVMVGDPPHGTAAIGGGGNNISYTPDLNYNGTDSFTYQVTDGNGNYDTATVTVTVTAVNDAPVAMDDAITINEDATNVAVNVRANDTDVDGDAISVVAVSPTSPPGGAVTFTATGVTFTPPANFSGTMIFTYTVEDDGTPVLDGTGTVTVTVNAVSDGDPNATNDAVTTDEDTAVTFDPTVAGGGIAQAGILADTIPAGDLPCLITIATPPTKGTAVVNDDMTITYTPGKNENGSDSFTYTLADSDGLNPDTATVTVTVTAVDDVADGVEDWAGTLVNAAVTIDVLANDVGDPDLAITDWNSGSNGTVTLVGGKLVYTPDADFVGTDEFSYDMEDDDGQDSLSVSVTVMVFRRVNTQPTLNAGDNFGGAIASLGMDLTGSAGPSHEYLVGAPNYGDEGAVFLIDGDDGSILRTITETDGGGGSMLLGTSIAVSVGQGFFYVGAPDYRSGHTTTGAVFNYSFGSSVSGFPTGNFSMTTGQKNSRFGQVVKVYRDVGWYSSHPEILVGAPGWDYNGNGDGVVIMIDGYYLWWNWQYFGNPEAEDNDAFGTSIAVGQFDADGTLDFAAGAPNDPNADLAGVGTVYVWSTQLNGWTAVAHPDPAEGDHFGAALAAGDFTGSGVDDLAVGAPGADNGTAANAGRMYIVDVDAGTSVAVENPDPDAEDAFGSVIVSDGQIIVVGVPLNDVGVYNDAGTVYGFAGDGTLLGSMDNPEPADGDLTAGDQFGAYVYLDGNGYMFVGAPLDDPDPGSGAVLDAGSLYVTLPYIE